jgi:hypothetical protein
LACLTGTASADQNGAFQEGKGLGTAATQGVFDSIDSGTVSGKIPAYGTSPAETQYYQGGQGQLTGPGVGKMQGCGSYTPGSDKIANQECEAVNFLARNPQVRPQFNITKNDPMIIGAENARDNAESFFQSLGGAGSSSQCTTRTETTPAQYATETCSSIGEIGTEQCAMGRLIDIDTDANFQCEQTVNAYETLTCDDSSVGCTQTGTALQCAPVSTLCLPDGDSCCWITVTCNAGVSATVRYGGCCGTTFTRTITDVTEFLSGVPYNPAGAKITCNNDGKCTISYENFYCNNPSVSIGHYDNVNSFNMTTRPTWSCTTGGGCEALDARTR